MNKCEHYQSELSALLDGEASLSGAIELLDHLVACSTCRDFFEELRSFQEHVDRLAEPLAVASRPATGRRFSSSVVTVPQWAWGLAAAVTLMVTVFSINMVRNSQGDPTFLSTPTSVSVAENSLPMSEERFVEIVTELLQDGRRYHNDTIRILDRFQYPSSDDEVAGRYAVASVEGGDFLGQDPVSTSMRSPRIAN